MSERKRTETLPRHSARDGRVCPSIYRRHGTECGTGDARGEKGDLDGQLTCNGTRRFRPWAYAVAVFLRRSRPLFSMHTRRHTAVRVKFGCYFVVGCLVSYLNDAVASASFDRLCAIMIPVIYLMTERSAWEGEVTSSLSDWKTKGRCREE